MGWDGFADTVILDDDFIKSRLQEFGIDTSVNSNYHLSKQSMVCATTFDNGNYHAPFEVWAIDEEHGIANCDTRFVDCILLLVKNSDNTRLRFGQKGHWIWSVFSIKSGPFYYNCPPSYIKEWINTVDENWIHKGIAFNYIERWLEWWKDKNQIDIKLEFGICDQWLEDYNYIQHIYDPQLGLKCF